MSSFLTVEDINTTLFNNQSFWTYYLDLSQFENEESFTNIKIDFCTVSKTKENNKNIYTIQIDNELWTKGAMIKDIGGLMGSLNGNTWTINTSWIVKGIWLYMGLIKYNSLTEKFWDIVNPILNLNFKQLQQTQSINVYNINHPTQTKNINMSVNVGYNEVSYVYNNIPYTCGYLLVNLVKSDFKFNCTQGLTVGKVNRVALGTDLEYKPSGAMVGNYNPKLTVYYGDEKLPVTYDSTLNDYVFDLDLTDKTTEGKIHFTVLVEGNEVLNETQTTVSLDSTYETINNLSKLTQLFRNGGTGRLGADITLTGDLTLTKDVLIVGNDKTLTLDECKIIVPVDKTFKAENTLFTGGTNTIQQNTGSTVELNECTFTNCTGLGSVIDCQVDIHSLENDTDFKTTITSCTFDNCDMIILHGGDLTVTNCDITGKIGNKDYPYFLYQTDGSAILTDNIFRLTSDSQIESDIEFNSCIFTVGDLATINGHGHTELSQNNFTAFIDMQRNHSRINVTYLYEPINEYIHLEASKGFCHSASGIDNIYKTNVSVTRE